MGSLGSLGVVRTAEQVCPCQAIPSPTLPGAHSILCSISEKEKKNDTVSQAGIIVQCEENITNDQLPFAAIVSEAEDKSESERTTAHNP